MVDMSTLAITLVSAPVSVALVNGLFARVKRYKEGSPVKKPSLFVNGERDEIVAMLDELREANLEMARRHNRADGKLADVGRRVQDLEETVGSAYSFDKMINDLQKRVQKLEEA